MMMGKDSTSVSSSNSTIANYLYRLILRTATLPIVVEPLPTPPYCTIMGERLVLLARCPLADYAAHIIVLGHPSLTFTTTHLLASLLPCACSPTFSYLYNTIRPFPSLFPGLFELPPFSTHPPYADCLFTGTLFSCVCLVIAAVTSTWSSPCPLDPRH